MNKKPKKKKERSLKLVVTLLLSAVTFITVLVLACTSALTLKRIEKASVEEYENAMMDGYKTEIKSQVQSAIAILQSFYDAYEDGTYTQDEARTLAKETIRNMRYRDDGSGYMWIDSTNYILVMHPILTSNEGSNRYNLEDQNGVMIIQNIMAAAEAGGGYNEFYFTKSDGETVAPKLAYSELFEPWGWVVTTGNYIDDMQAEMEDMQGDLTDMFAQSIAANIVEAVILVVLSLIISYLIVRMIVRFLNKIKSDLEMVAEGNLRIHADDRLLNRSDEIGAMGNSLQNVVDSLKDMITEVNESAYSVNGCSEEFQNKFNDIEESITSINQAVDDIANGATLQTQDADTVNAKVKDLDEIIRKEQEVVATLKNVVGNLAESADAMFDNLKGLEATSDNMQNAIGVVKTQTMKTNKSAQDIREAVGMITNIAFQTNLLSLNANIEAARVGEAGKGFAVVADEIRKLSDESTSGADVIEKSVNALLSDANSSVEKMSEAEKNLEVEMATITETIEAFRELYQLMDNVKSVSEQIDVLAEELTEVKDIVTNSVSSLAAVSQQSAAATQETSANMQMVTSLVNECAGEVIRLLNTSNTLKQNVQRFRV